MTDYRRTLFGQSEANSPNAQLNRTVIDPDRISAVEHSQLAGLQVADAVASAFHFALRVNSYGETEPGYLPHLKETIYRHKGAAMGYGIKVWPGNSTAIRGTAPEATVLEGL